MTRKIHDEIYWIQECNPREGFGDRPAEQLPEWYRSGREVHLPQNAYLFCDDQTLLFDTLARTGTDLIRAELEQILDGRDLDYLVISHPETPHAGNTRDILEWYPECTLVAPDQRSVHELYFLDEAKKVSEGDTIDLGRYTVMFERPVFLDHSVHLWMSEQTTETLFTVDWVGYPHMETECGRFLDEIDADRIPDRVRTFHERVLYWFKYADVTKTDAEIDHLIEHHGPSILAPAHGLVIREDVDSYLRQMKGVIRELAAAESEAAIGGGEQ